MWFTKENTIFTSQKWLNLLTAFKHKELNKYVENIFQNIISYTFLLEDYSHTQTLGPSIRLTFKQTKMTSFNICDHFGLFCVFKRKKNVCRWERNRTETKHFACSEFLQISFPPQYSKSPFCIITEYFNAALTAVTELERTLPLEHHKCMNSIESNPNLSAG